MFGVNNKLGKKHDGTVSGKNQKSLFLKPARVSILYEMQLRLNFGKKLRYLL